MLVSDDRLRQAQASAAARIKLRVWKLQAFRFERQGDSGQGQAALELGPGSMSVLEPTSVGSKLPARQLRGS